MLIAASQNANYGSVTVRNQTKDAMDRNEDIASRLRRLRLAYGFQQARAWCEYIGVSESVWNPFERGNRRITLEVALKVAQKTGAGLDWIYRGMEHTLPMHVVDRLRAVPDGDTELVDRRRRA